MSSIKHNKYSQSIIPTIRKINRANFATQANIEGTCEKYVIMHQTKPKEYIKFSKIDEVFSEVFSSYILNEIGIPCVSYSFVTEQVAGKLKIGTISSDYSEGSEFRVSLASMADSVGMIDRLDIPANIYINLQKAMVIIENFCKMDYINLTNEEKEQIYSLFETQIIADFALCNSDHHLRNIEFLGFNKNGKKKIELVPMFDLGQTFRSANAKMALIFEEIPDKNIEEMRKNGISQAQQNAKCIIDYFRNNYKTPKELAKNKAFRLLCYFIDYNFSNEIYNFLNSVNNQHRFRNQNYISEDNYYPIISTLINQFESKLLTKEIIKWESMKSAFEERRSIMYEEFSSDEFLFDAYKYAKPIEKTTYTQTPQNGFQF